MGDDVDDDDFAELGEDELMGDVSVVPETSIERDLKEAQIAIELESPENKAHEAEVRNEAEFNKKRERTKKRIQSLLETTKRLDAEKEQAFKLAQDQWQRAQALQARLNQSETIAIAQGKQRVESNIEQLKGVIRNAYAQGDAEALIKAQEQLAALTVEREKIAMYQPAPPPNPNEAPPQRPAPQPDDKARVWGLKNEWFGKDDEMTSLAYGLHAKIIKEGVHPNSDEYYERIDRGMRQRFPEKFGLDTNQARKPASAPVVAGVNRSPGVPKGRVGLTPTESALAKRLGLTDAQYLASKQAYEAR